MQSTVNGRPHADTNLPAAYTTCDASRSRLSRRIVTTGTKAGNRYRHRMTDAGSFRRTCHAAAHMTGGTVIEFRLADGVTPNFHQGLIAYDDRTVAVACTRDAAILAVVEPRAIDFADGARASGPLTYVDARNVELRLPPGRQLLTMLLARLRRYHVQADHVSRLPTRSSSMPGTRGIPADPVRQSAISLVCKGD